MTTRLVTTSPPPLPPPPSATLELISSAARALDRGQRGAGPPSRKRPAKSASAPSPREDSCSAARSSPSCSVASSTVQPLRTSQVPEPARSPRGSPAARPQVARGQQLGALVSSPAAPCRTHCPGDAAPRGSGPAPWPDLRGVPLSTPAMICSKQHSTATARGTPAAPVGLTWRRGCAGSGISPGPRS